MVLHQSVKMSLTQQSLHNVEFVGESSKVTKISPWVIVWFTCTNTNTRKSFAHTHKHTHTHTHTTLTHKFFLIHCRSSSETWVQAVWCQYELSLCHFSLWYFFRLNEETTDSSVWAHSDQIRCCSETIGFPIHFRVGGQTHTLKWMGS